MSKVEYQDKIYRNSAEISSICLALIASSLLSDRYEVWTDVNGVFTADPNKIDNAQIIKEINYEQAQELSAMGAKILHPFSILPCKEKNIPIIIKNTFSHNSNNTCIHNIKNKINKLYAITDQHNVCVLKITSLNMWNNYGFVYDIFKEFSLLNMDVNIITTSQFSITTTTNEKDMSKIIKLEKVLSKKYNVEVFKDCSILSIVGA